MRWKTVIPGVAAIAIGVGVAGCAFADTDKHGLDDDAKAMLAAKVTLTDAIATAEREAGGKAIDAGMDDQDGTLFIAVSVAQGEKIQKVLIDPQTGKVAKIGAKDDDEEDGDQNDE
jgi:uncharacterized membrane protein YkoI